MSLDGEVLKVESELPLDALAVQMAKTSHEVLIEFVKDLDAHVADMDFTRALRDFFIEEVRREEGFDNDDIDGDDIDFDLDGCGESGDT